jgi:hypothetical protein
MKSRERVLKDYVSYAKAHNGLAPNRGRMGPGTWELLAAELLGTCPTCGRGSSDVTQLEDGRTALLVAGVPIFCDLSQIEGTLALENTRTREDASVAGGYEATVV